MAGVVAGLAALSVAPAIALECVATSIHQHYWWHEESPETYVLVLGAFSDLKLVEAVVAAVTADGLRIGRKVF